MRPFYDEFAWAYDRLIDRPIEAECERLARALALHGVPAPARLLDAGYGTGRYALELARQGYDVSGIDRSPAMIAEARAAAGPARAVSFDVGDIVDRTEIGTYDAVLCRGVLNDLLDERERQGAFSTFARALRDGGLLVFDVREWTATLERKRAHPVFEKTVSTDRGRLSFRSVTELDPEQRRLLVTERHALALDGDETVASFRFIMKCWSRDEVEDRLVRAGFRALEIEPMTDRLAVIARRSARSACEA